jgi:hypothetical protein
MGKGKIKKFFAGANTAYGFYSLFDYIPDKKRENLFILKGGPGTGKSTTMKRIGDELGEQGFDTELFYCSSDNESLDGLNVPSLGLTVVDGTAPHVIDPRLPGAYDQIVNLGGYWNTEKLRQHRQEIDELIRQNSSYFTQAYQYLKEAYSVMEKMRYLMSLAMDFYMVNKISHQLISELVTALPPAEKKPHERHLFAGAITPVGLINFYPSILQDVTTFYLLTGDPGSGKSYLLQRIYEAVAGAGHDVELYHCAFDPERLDALVIPALRTAFVKATYPHTFTASPVQAIHSQFTLALSRHSSVASLKKTAGERSENQDHFWHLIGKAVEMIRKSKRNHDELEEYYIAAMDFQLAGQIQKEIIQKALSLQVAIG